MSIYRFEKLLLAGHCNLRATARAVISAGLIKVNAEYTAALVHQSLKVWQTQAIKLGKERQDGRGSGVPTHPYCGRHDINMRRRETERVGEVQHRWREAKKRNRAGKLTLDISQLNATSISSTTTIIIIAIAIKLSTQTNVLNAQGVHTGVCVCTPMSECMWDFFFYPVLNVVVQLCVFNPHIKRCHIQAITWQRPASSQHPWAPVMGIQPVTDHPPVPSRQHFRSSSSSSMLLGNKTNVIPLLVKFTWRDKGRQSATGLFVPN